MVNIRCHKIDKVSPCGPEPKMQTILAVWSACIQVRNCRPFCKHWKLPKCQLSRPVLFRSILALSKPYRSHCLNGTGLLATKCSKSTTAKNFHQETTHILNSFYSCSCYHFIPAAVIISFLQLLSFHSCSCFKTNKSAYTWHQSLFPQVVNHFFSGQDCCWSGGKPTCVNVKTTFKSWRTCFLSDCKWNKVEIWIRMQT